MKKNTFLPIAGFALALSTIPVNAQVFGSLANFDVVNDTGSVAHGFEIEIDGIKSTDISSLFGAANRWPGMERYGAPVVTDLTDAQGKPLVKITYKATNNGAWSAGTPSGTLPVSPSDSCWPLGAKAYGPNYPCDHFGVSTNVSTPNVKYSWLVETSPGANTLTPVAATVPNPVWNVVPQPPINNVPQPPKVNVVIVAPKPLQYEFGEPRWVKVTATGTSNDVAVEDLVAENAVIQKARTQTQLEWQLLQTDTGNPAAGQIDLTGVALDPGAKAVVYRFEFYKYTGKRDPATNEALFGPNGDTPGAKGPSAGDLGAFMVAQNAGVNFDGKIPAAPPLPVAPSLNATIPGATVNSTYSQVITAKPGVANDALVMTVDGLPAGLSFNPVTNTISGIPAVIGTFPLTITVKDTTNNTSVSATTNIQVADSAMVFNLPLYQGTVGMAYNQTLSVTGGYGPITYTAFGSLPNGLTLSGNSITGVPVTAGSSVVQIIAKDSLGYTQNASNTLTVAAAPAFNPPPAAATPCSATNQRISNISKFWMDINGGIPNGGQSVYYATQANTTFIAPLVAANAFKFGNLVTYSGKTDGYGFCLADTMTLAPALSLAPVTLPNAQVGTSYSSPAITPAGGVKPYTVAVSGLPADLYYNGTNIVGLPTLGANGAKTVSISVTDSIGETVNTTLPLTVNAAPVIVPSVTLPVATVGVKYTGSVSATGGVGSVTLSVTGLPAGLSYSAGSITGTPTTAGAATITITAKDTIGQTVSTTKVLSVVKAITLGASSIPATGKVNVAYKGTAKATGGSGTLTWSATGLPTGVTITSAGAISGTPTTAGTYNAVLTVKDGSGQLATVKAKIVISP